MFAAVLSVWATAIVPAQPEGARTVVASCDFEGPYSSGEHQIHGGCANNWQWGRKDILLRLTRLPSDMQLLDVMGNDPRRDAVKTWTIGWQPLFIVSTGRSAERLAALGRRALEG